VSSKNTSLSPDFLADPLSTSSVYSNNCDFISWSNEVYIIFVRQHLQSQRSFAIRNIGRVLLQFDKLFVDKYTSIMH